MNRFRAPTGAREAIDHVLLDPPRHRADETLGRRRRVGRADLEDLGDQGRIVGNPVAHDDPAAGPRHTDELLGDVERLRREHRSEDADDEVEASSSRSAGSMRRLLGTGSCRGPASARVVAGLDEVARDVDTQHVRAEPRRRQRGGAVTAPEVQDLEPVGDPQFLDERLAALSHRRRDASEVALSHSAWFGFIDRSFRSWSCDRTRWFVRASRIAPRVLRATHDPGRGQEHDGERGERQPVGAGGPGAGVAERREQRRPSREPPSARMRRAPRS